MEEQDLFMGEEAGEEIAPSPRSDLLEDIFGEVKEAPKKKRMTRRIIDDAPIEVDLPEGALPSTMREEPEDWAEAEEWDEEEEDWEDFEEMEDLEDEDEWGEEEEEEVLVVTCKCGEEIEVPSTGDGRFRCPECGRSGRVKV
jgi:hypothetical protein